VPKNYNIYKRCNDKTEEKKKNNSPLTSSILVFDVPPPNGFRHLHVIPCKMYVREDPGIVMMYVLVVGLHVYV
jgi:hypothetical protein